MANGLDDAWNRVEGWLRQNAPTVWQRLAPPATDADLVAVERIHDLRLPADLAAWWRRSDGMRPGAGSTGSIIPGGFYPASTAGAVTNLSYGRQMAAQAADEDPTYADTVAEMRLQPAGTTSDAWARLDEWITISEDADALFVDCRDGDLHGCVMMRFVTGGQIRPLWRNVASLWNEAADVLESIDPTAPPESVATSFTRWEIPSAWWERTD